MNDAEWVGWTIIGVVAIVGVYMIAHIIYVNASEMRKHDQVVRTAKIEACRTIPDQSLRTLCIVEGGTK